METIAAIATPLGNGAVGIIRMSGDKALSIASSVFTPLSAEDFSHATPNTMYLGRLVCGGISDKILAVYFAAPRSYTGEDIVEFHCHGGSALLRHVLQGLTDRGARIADRGEFTRRAFLNGKLALSDAEGVIDMINGDSAAAVNAGYRLVSGSTSAAIHSVTESLLSSIAYMEAGLDYPEEMEEESRRNAKEVISSCITQVQNLLSTCKKGSFVKNGVNVAIVGETNVGKSSLLNALVGRDRAIVTDIAGTTRDSIEEVIEEQGIALRLIDTAGIRESSDVVESIGIQRSRNIAENSDIVLFITDGSRPSNAQERALLKSLQQKTQVITVVNKCDLPSENAIEGMKISARGNINVDELKREIIRRVIGEHIDSSGEIITSLRHKDALERALASLVSAQGSFDIAPTECTLLDMRAAYSALGEITGDTADEKIIDSIFSQFCLGK